MLVNNGDHVEALRVAQEVSKHMSAPDLYEYQVWGLEDFEIKELVVELQWRLSNSGTKNQYLSDWEKGEISAGITHLLSEKSKARLSKAQPTYMASKHSFSYEEALTRIDRNEGSFADGDLSTEVYMRFYKDPQFRVARAPGGTHFGEFNISRVASLDE